MITKEKKRKCVQAGDIGVHVSSIVKWGYIDNFKPVYFFYEKILQPQKAPKRKTSDFHPFKSLWTQKIVAFFV